MKRIQRIIAVGLAGLLVTAVWPASGVLAQASDWRDSGITLPDNQFSPACFDTHQPDVVVTNAQETTVAYHWSTGQQTILSDQRIYLCGPDGLVYAGDPGQDRAVRFRASDPRPQALAHSPTHVAEDGTLHVYALTPQTSGPPPRMAPRLWASADGGLTWRRRDARLGGWIEALAVSSTDARAIYALVSDRDARLLRPLLRYSIYYSPDAGVTWERRSGGQAEGVAEFGGPYLGLASLPGRISPVGAVLLSISRGNPGSSARSEFFLSGDGGRSFAPVGAWAIAERTQLVATSDGVLRMHSSGYSYSLSKSVDGGRNWETLASPPLPPANIPVYPDLTVVRDSPSDVLLRDGANLWHSPDGGRSWQGFEDRTASGQGPLAVSPFLPVTILGGRNNRLWALDLPDAGARLGEGVAPSDAPDSRSFIETRHTLAGAFRRYWERHGGLAQFGYPISEPFRERNRSDGRVYLTQYFERSRFEYHPELCTCTEPVLLGLLGSQLTVARHMAGEAPFTRMDDPQRSDIRYFPQTGHTLSGVFGRYWERHGGLAQFGYPISEPFFETNPDDGVTYLVQYFERNRFEYHPELAGSDHEVLLGRLGVSAFQVR